MRDEILIMHHVLNNGRDFKKLCSLECKKLMVIEDEVSSIFRPLNMYAWRFKVNNAWTTLHTKAHARSMKADELHKFSAYFNL